MQAAVQASLAAASHLYLWRDNAKMVAPAAYPARAIQIVTLVKISPMLIYNLYIQF